MPITASETRAFEIAEKVTSILSVVGAAFIVTTFLLNSKFRKPINRLVFYAAWGNLFANVATLISRSGIKLGITTPLCQFQAFLIQWYVFCQMEPFDDRIVNGATGLCPPTRSGPLRWLATSTFPSFNTLTHRNFEPLSGNIFVPVMEHLLSRHLCICSLARLTGARYMEALSYVSFIPVSFPAPPDKFAVMVLGV